MKLVSWNVNGARAREAEILALIARESPDVLCLQEVKAVPEDLPASLYGLMALPDYYARWHGGGGYSGVALLLKRSAFSQPKFSHPSFDMETRVVVADVGARTFASIYAPNGNKDYGAKIAFYEGMLAWAEALAAEGRELYLIGDLNIARAPMDVYKGLRKAGTIGQREEERVLFERLLEKAHLVDACRALAPDDGAIFTWWPYWRESRQKNHGWRIDYALVSASVAGKLVLHEVRADVGGSDHGPVVVELSEA